MIDAECVSQIDETKTEELAKDPEYVKDVAAVVEEWVSFSEKKISENQRFSWNRFEQMSFFGRSSILLNVSGN